MTDAEWAIVAPLLPKPRDRGRHRRWRWREMLNVIFYVLRANCPWRLLPDSFPPWRTVYRLFGELCDGGGFEGLSVTRERMFFHKLCFDLKLAAARRGYALTLFAPEVDRDAYDVMLDDGDTQRRVQLKTVLKTAKTAVWESTKRFMRMEEVYGDRMGLAPADCGVGGGFVLIEIDDTDDEGRVGYLFTDYAVIRAQASHIIAPARSRRGLKSFGQPAKDRADFAVDFLAELRRGSARDPIELARKLFIRAAGTNELLALLGLHSTSDVHLPCDRVMMALIAGFSVDPDGVPLPGVAQSARMRAELACEGLLALSDEPSLRQYRR